MKGQFPPEIDMTTPSIARMYDYLLKGKDNFACDRTAIDAMTEDLPEVVALALDNRAYLGRAVNYVARETGVSQFLDLGAGLPTAENTHQIVQRAVPGARVVYVDNDPIVLAHGRAILADNPATTVITADIRDPETILTSSKTTELIDFDRPVCVMLVSLLHCIPDADDPFGIVERLFERLVPGSYLVYSHIVSDDEEVARDLTERVHAEGTEWGRVRSPEEAARVFDRLKVVEPGQVECSTWRHPHRMPSRTPHDPTHRLWEHAGVGYKP
ncbi:SAM-dependent methyltransferase [Salinactinospora qingdaonensis]|uniref:SAM-dependent methyltransferase n=1 Tax=Salinactinospora qingdaonensis TaxID=702744 RepID=A0ABP7FAR7_9ACTN